MTIFSLSVLSIHLLRGALKKDFIYLSIYSYIYLLREGRERGKEGEKHLCTRETSIGCLSHAPNEGPGLQPMHTP